MSLVTIEINGKSVEAPRGPPFHKLRNPPAFPFRRSADDERLSPTGPAACAWWKSRSAGVPAWWLRASILSRKA
jgi:hypothetical protein